ncbi:MAG: hypothetical protein A3G49_04205 [Candidatus Sungbacteria bacterium RIFCSPLOWO2_12_FULL_41_11]|uniref:Uncharacterized protein n=1 Tax=Candidatus Sungbacteria bacterium RIFCSPLOWO2_12_FULL_41_11 TaxID=1802286 RepID=A0A1G2LTI5_9BACT|nr:MAG: hypothetical protein UV01_C0010G0026 [Parcubacteria group bacterium GW2011_GWA2_42_14]OGZ99338.1 MAG: hypothetical protein A3D41_02670 [Candidatus Sungbacteria bacterium RIFCSPHIGHO2_02_FULL_41_12b]OHA14863.1 MAG: hypothetical protein A3G49_04205 [Candidatus Sungbacteria bacterium RIFCSPLOWO2_12_FULL_41_11]
MGFGFESINSPEQKEGIRADLLRRGKGWEAINYALQESLPYGDDDTLTAERAAPHEKARILTWRYGEDF